MSTLGGPKGPAGRSPALERFLETERQKRSERERAVDPPAARETRAAPTTAPHSLDRFGADRPGFSDPNGPITGGFLAQTGMPQSPGQGALSVRLNTMTGAGATDGAEHRGLRIVHGPTGKVAEGDLSVTKASDLDVLKGVVLLRGSLDLSETLLTDKDLLALKSLERVEGSLALEGNVELSAVSALARLSHVGGNLYLGFNDGLEDASLPALTRVDGALVVEGNPGLRELSLPSLLEVGSYLHLHENDALTAASFGKLREVKGEVSLVENPRLGTVDVRSLERLGGDLENADNGGLVLTGLPTAPSA